MGWKGDLLRKQKKDNTVYRFTRAELEAHDNQVKAEYRKFLDARLEEKYKLEHDKLVNQINEEWEIRKKEFGSPDTTENFFNMMTYLLSVSCRVLVEQFKWTPLPKSCYFGVKRYRLARFADAVIDEIDRIATDDLQDIRSYAADTYDKYGVKFMREDEAS